MSSPTPASPTTFYALRVHPVEPGRPRRLAGRLEHVLSGRCREFDDAATLLAWLADDRFATARPTEWLPDPLSAVTLSERPVATDAAEAA